MLVNILVLFRYDYLRVFDGGDPKGKLLGGFCGRTVSEWAFFEKMFFLIVTSHIFVFCYASTFFPDMIKTTVVFSF